jgi:hypothetical protein
MGFLYVGLGASQKWAELETAVPGFPRAEWRINAAIGFRFGGPMVVGDIGGLLVLFSWGEF